MIRIIRAAVQYWAVVFAFAFVVGVGRTLWLAPWVGAAWAVVLELPLVLGASWLAARTLTRRHGITSRRQALAMGALAFALLLLAEALLARALAGHPARMVRRAAGSAGDLRAGGAGGVCGDASVPRQQVRLKPLTSATE